MTLGATTQKRDQYPLGKPLSGFLIKGKRELGQVDTREEDIIGKCHARKKGTAVGLGSLAGGTLKPGCRPRIRGEYKDVKLER